MATDDEVLDAQRAAWADLAPGWDRWDAVIQDQLGPVGTVIVDRLDVQPGQRHLDIASGTGEPGLTVARRAPEARVVLTDISAEMLDVAARRAREEGLGNVETVMCSANDLPFDDAVVGSVSMRFGYMFLPDLRRATREIARVLHPGGRFASSVWVRPDDNPWTSLALDAVATQIALPPRDPDAPSMFRCAPPGLVADLYADAGLRDVEELDVDVALVTQSPEEYWAMMSEHVSLVAAALHGADPAQRERIAAEAIERVTAYQQPDGQVRVPGAARVVVGTR